MHGRLIPLRSCAPPDNMAIDQALLESVDVGAEPALRFYTWDRPTLSLGYFQPLRQRREHAASRSLACVRRASGGGAIVHHHELTYSVIVPDTPLPQAGSRAGPRIDLYRRTHAAIATTLARLGPRPVPFRLSGREGWDQRSFLCFRRRTEEDLIVAGYKVLGSAQRRGRRSVLQHGSLLLRASSGAPELPGLYDLGACPIAIESLAGEVAAALAEALGIHWRVGHLSRDERENAGQIAANRFASAAWTERR